MQPEIHLNGVHNEIPTIKKLFA